MLGLRHALRSLKRSPGFCATATLVLALGIAAVTLTFSVANAFFFRSLPFREPETLVHVWQTDPRLGSELGVSVPNFLDWKARNKVFKDLGGYYSGTVDVITEGRPLQVPFGRVTPNLIGLLGVEPLLGRTFTPDEDQAGRDHVVILAESFWRGRFGGSPSVIGKTLEMEAMAFTIVGVMPSEFAFPSRAAQVWVPLPLEPSRPRGSNGALRVVGRLRPGTAVRAAQAEMSSLMEDLAEEYPDANQGKTATVVPLRRALLSSYDRIQRGVALATAASGFLLLMVCANVGNLLLVRGAGRRREIAVRMAMGGSRLRVTWELFTESILLALAGGVLGVGLAAGLVRLLSPLVSEDLYRAGNLEIDGSVLAFTVLASIASALVFGLAPALDATGRSPSRFLKEGDRGAIVDRSGRKLRSALVVSQVAIAVVLLVGSALAIQSFLRLRSANLGFNPDNVVTLELLLPTSKYNSARAHNLFYAEVVHRLGSMPGVTAVAYTYPLPLTEERHVMSFEVRNDVSRAEKQSAPAFSVSPGYFTAMEIPFLRGRDFGGADDLESARVVVVNRRMAERVWPGRDAVGQTVRLDPGSRGERIATVIGVVADSKHRASEETPSSIYTSQLQVGTRGRVLVVRTESEPLEVVAAAKREIETLDPIVPITTIRTMNEVLSESLLLRREGTRALAVLGGVALALAALGVYGVVSYVAGQRAFEIGVRVALGAERRDVAALVLYEGAFLAAAGVVLGLAGAAGFTKLMESLLYDVRALDLLSFVEASLAISIVTLLAAYVPARRASQTDPARVLARS